MVAPLNFAKLDNLAACDMAGKLENLDWFLLIGQIAIQLNRFQWHYISQMNISHLCVSLLQLGKRGTHRELLTILSAIPTCKQLLPYAPKIVWSRKTWH